jgi:hypothetical protein
MATVSFGAGVSVQDGAIVVSDDGTELTAKIHVADNAKLGGRSLTVTNPDCSSATLASEMGKRRILIPFSSQTASITYAALVQRFPSLVRSG